MTSRWSRRQFVVGAGAASLGLLAGCGHLPWQTQQPSKMPRVGVLGGGTLASSPWTEAFRQGLRELGYVEGQNVVIEWRFGEMRQERTLEHARELARLPVDVIVAPGNAQVYPATQATSTVPIVMVDASDPIGAGFVASLARPGGNVTGLSGLFRELNGKRLELLKEAVPGISRVAALGGQDLGTGSGASIREARAAADALGLELHLLSVGAPDELEPAFDTAAQQGVEGLLVLSRPVTVSNMARIADQAVARRLAAVFDRREFAEAGGLMAYGPSLTGQLRRAAYYVDKILKGAKPADLPVEQPQEVEFVINLRTARALGLTIPEVVLVRATEVIP